MSRPITFDPSRAIDAALELFWKRGYHAVSVEDIVRETGLNRHSLYARFGSKFGLLMSALEHYRGVVLEQVRERLARDGTNRDRIQQILTLHDLRNLAPDDPDAVWEKMLARGCFAIRVCAELRDSHQELGRHLDELADTLEQLIATVIRDGQACGEFRKDRTAEDLAAVLVSGFLAPLIYTPPTPHTDAFLAVLD